MIDQFFARFMKTEAGKSLLADIPKERKKFVECKLEIAFFAGVEASALLFIMDQINGLSTDDKTLVMRFLKDELNL